MSYFVVLLVIGILYMIIVTKNPLEFAFLRKITSGAGKTGAVVVFIGTVRNFNKGKKVRAIEYTAYEKMAKKDLARIAVECMRKWDVMKVDIAHRTGLLKVNEASIITIVTASHRKDAYAASRYVIEEIKKTTPIWKKEIIAETKN